jgi:hypothetical protein
MDMGVILRTAGLNGRGELVPGEGNNSFALGVGESGVGNPGYFRSMSVERERWGRMASGWGKESSRLPMLITGPLP